jgi:hypothetical protein
MTTLTHTAPQQRDFSARVLRSLLTRGIAIVGVTLIPGDGELSMANGSTGYVLNDNGTQRIVRHGEVIVLALRPKGENEYCVVYRTGTPDNFLWWRSEPMPREDAQRLDLGDRSYVVKYRESMMIGLPETYE